MAARLSAAERRADVVDAAVVEFAKRGLDATSTEDIARRAGISQPYLFRLFETKKELFKAANGTRLPRATGGLREGERRESAARRHSARSAMHTSTKR
jgi:AcrR family transcriptional regulator